MSLKKRLLGELRRGVKHGELRRVMKRIRDMLASIVRIVVFKMYVFNMVLILYRR